MLINQEYNRLASFAYAYKWWNTRNPDYYDFADVGGDCTSFISQCVYAGSRVMNYKPIFGWYYNDSRDRTASWTGVEYFYNFMVSNTGEGPHMSISKLADMRVGDVVQLGDDTGRFFHTLLVVRVGRVPTPQNILLATHSFDAWLRPLDTYDFAVARFLHVDGVNINI